MLKIKHMKKTYTLALDENDVFTIIHNTFKANTADIMTKALMQIINNDEYDIGNLCKAALNITPTTKYKVGQKIIVKTSALSDWKWDSEKMKDLINNNSIIAEIVELLPFAKSPYSILYDVYKDGNKHTVKENAYVSDYYITALEEIFPGDIN
jgi:hypothetical protein